MTTHDESTHQPVSDRWSLPSSTFSDGIRRKIDEALNAWLRDYAGTKATASSCSRRSRGVTTTIEGCAMSNASLDQIAFKAQAG
jgi:hypothetical protein